MAFMKNSNQYLIHCKCDFKILNLILETFFNNDLVHKDNALVHKEI